MNNNFLKALVSFENFNILQGNDPTTKAEYDAIKDGTFLNGLNEEEKMFSGTPPTWEEIQAKVSELDAEDQAKIDLKTSAKAKLIAGEPLTEEEADTIVL
tara:strand:+ start:255 stop:554 length:300 start_codon:yes stop_codon:yes gene_type:complete